MANTSNPPPLTAAQLEVMQVIWECGEVTVTDVWQAVREIRDVARATVQTVIQRLEDKGWLMHREIGQAFVYSARHPRESTQGKLVSDLVESAFGGSASGLVKALLHDRKLSVEEAKRIRALIAAAEGQGANRRGANRRKKR